MTEKQRIDLPFVDGSFASESAIRIRSQVLFLSIANEVVPNLCTSLHMDVFPRFEVAADHELAHGASAFDVSELAIEAAVYILRARIQQKAIQGKEALEFQKRHRLVMEACNALIAWCEQHHLLPEDCQSGDEDSLMHMTWPATVGLETLYFWKFHALGPFYRATGRWRPPLLVIRPDNPPPSVLPPIRLTASCVDLKSKAVREIDLPGWYPTLELAAQFKKHARAAFDRWLNEYVNATAHGVAAAGLKTRPDKRIFQLHFTWLARYQINCDSPSRIAKDHRRAIDTIEEGIDSALKLVCLQKRPPERGGSKGTKHPPKARKPRLSKD